MSFQKEDMSLPVFMWRETAERSQNFSLSRVGFLGNSLFNLPKVEVAKFVNFKRSAQLSFLKFPEKRPESLGSVIQSSQPGIVVNLASQF